MNRLSGGRLAFLGLALTLACSPAPNILPTNDFNRPTDLAFMCLGAFGDARHGRGRQPDRDRAVPGLRPPDARVPPAARRRA